MSEIKTLTEWSIENDFNVIYEKIDNNPEIRSQIEEKIRKMASEIPEIKDTKLISIYEQYFKTYYAGNSEELAKLFSFIFRKHRDSLDSNLIEIKLDKNLKIVVGDVKNPEKIFVNWTKVVLAWSSVFENFNGKKTDLIPVQYQTINWLKNITYIPKKYTKEVKKINWIRDNYIRVQLKNKWSRLNVRSEDNLNKKITTFNDGVTIKDLKIKKQFNGLEYTLVEFFNNTWGISRWYISLNYTEEVKDESLRAVDWYIRSLWLNPTDEFKRAIFKRLYLFRNYRWNLQWLKNNKVNKETSARSNRDNTEIYNMLVINYELRKIIEKQELILSSKSDTISLYDLIHNNYPVPEPKKKLIPKISEESIPIKNKESIRKPKQKLIRRERKKQNPKINNINDDLNNNVIDRIRSDKKIVEYLEKNYKWNSFDEGLQLFKKRIWYKWNDFRANVMSYTYLFQHSRGYELWSYYKKITWQSFKSLWLNWERKLFNKYTWEVEEIYWGGKVSNRITILRWLLIENELWSKYLAWVKKEKSKDFYFEEIWIDIRSIISHWIEINPRTNNTLCSRTTVKDAFNNFKIKLGTWDSLDLIKKNPSLRYDISSLETELVKKAKINWEVIHDILITTKKWHRFLLITSKDWKSYVLDPYYKHNWVNNSKPYLLSSHSLSKRKWLTFIINWSYKPWNKV